MNYRINTRALLIILLAISIVACTKNLDYLYTFNIKGVIIDQSSNKPIGDVSIYFVDTGFDVWRSKQKTEIKIGTTDSQGKIDIPFEYWWGEKRGLFSKEPNKTFEIKISKESYEPVVIKFKDRELPREDGSGFVDLGTIIMQKNNM